MDCKTMVLDWLREHGADGLCEPENECGCGLDDFAPCGDGPYPHCKAAISRTLVEGEFIGDGGPGDKVYFVMPNAEVSERSAAEHDAATALPYDEKFLHHPDTGAGWKCYVCGYGGAANNYANTFCANCTDEDG